MGRGRAGWVYVLRDVEAPGVLKIGQSQRPPEERCQQVSYENGRSFALEFSEWFEDSRDGERGVHFRLDRYRVMGRGPEMFAVSVDEAIRVVGEIKQSGGNWKPDGGSLVQSRKAMCSKIGKTSKRHRNLVLYRWIKENFARLEGDLAGLKEWENGKFWVALGEWKASLGPNYKGRGVSQLGFAMEWWRVEKEMKNLRRFGDRDMLWEVRPASGFSTEGS